MLWWALLLSTIATPTALAGSAGLCVDETCAPGVWLPEAKGKPCASGVCAPFEVAPDVTCRLRLLSGPLRAECGR